MNREERKEATKRKSEELELVVKSDEVCIKARNFVKKLGGIFIIINLVLVLIMFVLMSMNSSLFTNEFKLKIMIESIISVIFLSLIVYSIYRHGNRLGGVVILLNGIYGLMNSIPLIKPGINATASFMGWTLLVTSIYALVIGILFLINKDIKHLKNIVKTEAAKLEKHNNVQV